MGKVVELKDYGTEKALAGGLDQWRAHFEDDLTIRTRLADLSDRTLLTLAMLQDQTSSLLQDIIMGFLGLGPGIKFHFLEGADKLRVLDVYLFAADQVRWECMRRLGWVEDFAGEQYPLIELILNAKKIKKEFSPKYPRLNRNHPDYDEYLSRREFEGEAVIRRLIPESLAALERRTKR